MKIKLYCSSVTGLDRGAVKVAMQATHLPNEDNKRIAAEGQPAVASAALVITKPAALGVFEAGEEYFVTFEKAPRPEPPKDASKPKANPAAASPKN